MADSLWTASVGLCYIIHLCLSNICLKGINVTLAQTTSHLIIIMVLNSCNQSHCMTSQKNTEWGCGRMEGCAVKQLDWGAEMLNIYRYLIFASIYYIITLSNCI